MKVLFLGTPEIAVPTLRELLADSRFTVVGLVTQPDRPAGRGNKVHAPPTKILAEQHNVPVFQPVSLSKAPEIVSQLKGLEPDYVAMVAFGQILRKSMLELPKKGTVNIHASLLPKWRGAAPINWAIIDGDTVSGITTMFTEAGVDTGPMLLRKEVPIGSDTTAEELGRELGEVGAKLLIETLIGLEDGSVKPIPQDDSGATLAPMLNKEMGKIDWKMPSIRIHNLVRGLMPWPGTHTSYKDAPLKILKTKPGAVAEPMTPGTVHYAGGMLSIACGDTGSERLGLIDVQPANKARMSAKDWANGAHLQSGDQLK